MTTTITRRAALRDLGAAAGSLPVALPALADDAAPSVIDPVIAMEAERQRLLGIADQCSETAETIFQNLPEHARQTPRVWVAAGLNDESAYCYSVGEIRKMYDGYRKRGSSKWIAALTKAEARQIARLEALAARYNAARTHAGYEAARTDADTAIQRYIAMEERLARTTATTLAGIAVRARLLAEWVKGGPRADYLDDMLAETIAEEIDRFAAGGAA